GGGGGAGRGPILARAFPAPGHGGQSAAGSHAGRGAGGPGLGAAPALRAAPLSRLPFLAFRPAARDRGDAAPAATPGQGRARGRLGADPAAPRRLSPAPAPPGVVPGGGVGHAGAGGRVVLDDGRRGRPGAAALSAARPAAGARAAAGPPGV